MNCPHCGFLNPDGRKFCRGCAKPLAAAPTAAQAPPPEDPILDTSAGDTSSFEPVAAEQPSVHAPHAESHVINPSAAVPASSSSLNPKIIAIAAVLIIAVGGGAFWFLHRGNNAQDASAAQAQNPVSSVAYHPDAASAKNREHLMAALRLIVAQQEARLAEDPDDLEVCAVNTFSDNELGHHARESHYIIDQQCQPRTADGRAIRNGFTVTATPKVEDNPADAPSYCVDQTKVIRRYADSGTLVNATSAQHLTCPLDGQPVQ